MGIVRSKDCSAGPEEAPISADDREVIEWILLGVEALVVGDVSLRPGVTYREANDNLFHLVHATACWYGETEEDDGVTAE
jgi:hypothetical protein